jgi:hypothetical protein
MPPSLADRLALCENRPGDAAWLESEQLARRGCNVRGREPSNFSKSALGRLLEDSIRYGENANRWQRIPAREELDNG